MNDKTLSIIIKAQDDASKTLEKIASTTERTAETTSRSWLKTSAVMGAVAGVITTVTAKAINGLSNTVGDAIKRVDTMNNFPRIMANFGVSAKDANVMIKDLDKGVRGLPTSLNDIVTLAEGFVPLTKNTQLATKTALALNNAILAGGAPAQVQAAALEQFRQALSKGVPDLQDWKSLETAMPAQLQQVNEKLGIGKGALKGYTNTGLGLYQAMKDGKLSMDDFNKALVSLNNQGIKGLPNFATQAKNATQGISTGIANAKTAVTRGIADIILAIGSGNISSAIANFGKGIEKVFKSIAQWLPLIISAASRVAESIYRTVAGIANWHFWLERLKLAVSTFARDARAVLLIVLSDIRLAFEKLLPSMLVLKDTIFNHLLPAVKRLWDFLEPILAPLLKKIALLFGATLFAAVWLAINALNALFKAATPVINFLSSHTWVIYGLATAFSVLAGVMAFNAIFDALTVGFSTLQLVTIPSLIATIETIGASSAVTAAKMIASFAIASAKMIFQAAATSASWVASATVTSTAWVVKELPKILLSMSITAIRSAVYAADTGLAWVLNAIRVSTVWTVTEMPKLIVSFITTSAQAVIHATITSAAWIASASRSAVAWVVTEMPRIIRSFIITSEAGFVQAGIVSGAWIASASRSAVAWVVTSLPRIIAAFAVTSASAVVNAAIATRAWMASAAASSKSVVAFRLLVASPIAMGAIAVAGAIADVMLVLKAVNTVRGAINDMQAAARSAAAAKTAQTSAHQTLVNLVQNGTPAQKARAQYQIMSGYASGGFTGRGSSSEVAGLVHKGEYVLPQSAVDQNTGTPKSMGNTFVMHGNIIVDSQARLDQLMTLINGNKEMAAYGVGV